MAAAARQAPHRQPGDPGYGPNSLSALMDREHGICPAIHKLREDIARAIFNHQYGRGMGWDLAKYEDQWLAIGAWEAAGRVLAILPLKIEVKA